MRRESLDDWVERSVIGRIVAINEDASVSNSDTRAASRAVNFDAERIETIVYPYYRDSVFSDKTRIRSVSRTRYATINDDHDDHDDHDHDPGLVSRSTTVECVCVPLWVSVYV